MTEKFKFTDSRIDSLKPSEKKLTIYRDSEVKSLVIRVSHTGNKSFSLYKKFKGVPRYFGSVSILQVRSLECNIFNHSTNDFIM